MNQWNGGATDAQMAAFRNGLAKLLNSLSYSAQIAVPKAIDPSGTVFRINLNDYNMSRGQWEEITARDPYQFFSGTDQEQEIIARTGVGESAIVRADWCASVCLQSEIYDILMQIPNNLQQLEFDFGVNADQDRTRRSSAPVSTPRACPPTTTIQYHRTRVGDYWKSFDFLPEGGDVRKNLFEFPLDAENFGGNVGFNFAAGEFIFQLPNGLSLYMLADNNGKRLDKAVQAVVQDPTREDAAVTNAVSCFRCHYEGMFPSRTMTRSALTSRPMHSPSPRKR